MEVKERMRRERVPVYLAPQNKDLLARMAAADGESMTGVLRALIRAEARRRGLLTATKLPAGLGR
ncbi:MAG TPA: hypothetical protein VHR86_04915 [Armatimonadota bacterium]|nr:hypothetical protein [Armatimonadota bacterium]